MKKVMLILLVFCGLLVAGCSEQTAKVTPSVWLLSGANVQDTESQNDMQDSLEYVGRLGIQVDQTEFGVASDWWMGSDPRQSYGIYAVRFLPLDLLGESYVGAQATLDVEEDSGGMYGFVAGTIVPVGGLDVVTEFQARQYSDDLADKMAGNDEYKAFVGLRFKF